MKVADMVNLQDTPSAGPLTEADMQATRIPRVPQSGRIGVDGSGIAVALALTAVIVLAVSGLWHLVARVLP